MANSNIQGFLNRIQNGVRPNLFQVDFAFPAGISVGTDIGEVTSVLCKAAALPASNLGVIEVPFRGRTVKIAGDRTFDTWTATFINDSNFAIRTAMETWMDAINKHERNTADVYNPGEGGSSNRKYTADLIVRQLARDESVSGRTLTGYKLWGCFPTNISQIDLAYDSNDQIEDFTVEFQLQYWTRGDAASYDSVIGGQASA